MAGPWSPSPSGAQSPEPSFPPGFDSFGSFLYDQCPDFDPVKEWLVDPDQFLMPEVERNGPTNPDGSDDPKTVEGFGESGSNPDGSSSGSKTTTELGLKEEFLKSSIDEKMGKVTLAEDSGQHRHPEGDSCMEIVETNVNANGAIDTRAFDDGNGFSSWGSGGAEEGNRAREVCTVSDSIKVAQASDEESNEAETKESEDNNEPSSDGSSSSSSSSSSGEKNDSDDGDGDGNRKNVSKGKRVAEAEEVEEGEIIGSDEDEEQDIRGLIRTNHEVEVLPPVPKIEASLEPHHQTLPVGVISSILANRVIVDGSVKHSPLNEGSILWITETRLPLGLVDEIFGPVKNPYYVVRYNLDQELPTGISVGTTVSFVMEFANCILNEKELQKKGYDASGEHDEELTDEVEFSDDEKEAEYKRSLQQAKRDHNNKRHGNQEFVSNMKRTIYRDAMVQEHMPPPSPRASVAMSPPLPGGLGPFQATLAISNMVCSNVSSFEAGNPSMSAPAMVPSVPPVVQVDSCFSDLSQQSLQQLPNAVPTSQQQLPNAVPTHGFPLQQQQPNAVQIPEFPQQQPAHAVLTNAIPTHGFPLQQQPNAVPNDGFPPQQPNATPTHGFPPQQQLNSVPNHGFPLLQPNAIPTHGFPLLQPNAIPTHGFPPQQQPNAVPNDGFPPQQPNATPTHGFPPQQQPNAVPNHGFPLLQPNAIPTHGFPLQQQPNAVPNHGFPLLQPNAIPTHGFPPQQQPNAVPNHGFPLLQPNATQTHGFPPQQQPNAVPNHGFPLLQPNSTQTHGFPPQQQPNAVPNHGFPLQQPNATPTHGFPPQQQENAILAHGFPPQQQLNAIFAHGFPPQEQPNAIWANGFPPQQQPNANWGHGYALQQQVNATWTPGFPPQQQNMGMQGGFLMNVLPDQQPGGNTYNHLHQDQVFNSLASGMLYQQQLISTLAALANTAWLGGSVNPSACLMALGSVAQGNLSQLPFGCHNMQEQGAPGFCNVQNNGQAPSTVTQGGTRPPMKFTPGRSSFRGRKPHHRGGRHPFNRGGRQ